MKLKFVLLVDDDLISNYLNQIIIGDLGFAEAFKFVNNGLEALQYLKDADIKSNNSEDFPLPDLILLDLNMPILDGFEFLDFFNKLTLKGKDKIKIVVLSSSIRNRDMADALQLGAHSYLTKPLTPEKIQAVVDKLFTESFEEDNATS